MHSKQNLHTSDNIGQLSKKKHLIKENFSPFNCKHLKIQISYNSQSPSFSISTSCLPKK